MKCQKCQAENPEARKFCRKCGTKLSLPYPRCGFEYLPGDEFCGECGTSLEKPKEAQSNYYSEPKSYSEKVSLMQNRFGTYSGKVEVKRVERRYSNGENNCQWYSN